MKKTALCLIIGALFISSGVNAQTANPSNLVNVNGVLFYTARTTANGYELWKTDGTGAGTVMVKDIYAGSDNSNPMYLTAVGSTLYFSANDGFTGVELWKTDGTTAGTVLVKDISLTGSSQPKYLSAQNGALYFCAEADISGYEPWKSDGTSAGTFILKDILPGTGGTAYVDPYFTTLGSEIFFRVNISIPFQLWKTDGSSVGTAMVSPDSHYNFGPIVRAGNKIFFESNAAGDRELWKSDGTAAGTSLLKEINTISDAYPRDFVVLGNTLYFTADHATLGAELWKTDGTEAGTTMVIDLFSGGSSNPHGTVAMNGILYFSSYGNNGDLELWKSDGTAAGTALVKNINPSGNSYPTYLTVIGNTLYFRADDGTSGFELWKSDGTAAGTVLVKNINPGINTSQPQSFTAVGNTLYFKADDGTSGMELWKSDGTTAGTVMIRDVVAPTIATSAVLATRCAGSTFNLFYTIGGIYNAGNVFTAQLSDETGSFATPVNIGTAATTTAGNIVITIPSATIPGTGYRIRVVSSSPFVTGSDNGTNITINPSPTAVITAPSNSLCPGGSLLLTSSAGSSYVWNKNGSTISGANTQTYSATSTGSFTVDVTNATGCTTTSAAFVVTPTVIANLTAPGTTLCPGGSLILTSSSGSSYQWKSGGVNIPGANSQTYTATVAGNYAVAVTTSGCSATSAIYVVTMNASTAIVNHPANATICVPNTATFTVSATGSNLSYQWRKNGVAIPGATSSNFTSPSSFSDAGTYDVVVTGSCGSVTSNTAILTVNNCTALPAINDEVEEVILMPNVVKNKTFLRISVRTAMKIDFIITDIKGKQIMIISKQLNAGKNDISLDMNSLSPGTYFLNGNSAKGKLETLKFIKQ